MNTNEEKPTEENVLKGDEAYELYKQGKDVWNKWAEEHEGWKVDFSSRIFEEGTSFAGFIFPGHTDFSNTTFCIDCDFKGSKFLSKTDSPNFYNAIFKKLIIIDHSHFERVPDFRMAIFKTGISMLDISVTYQGNILGKAIDKEDSARYREPKKLAGEAKDHEQLLRQ